MGDIPILGDVLGVVGLAPPKTPDVVQGPTPAEEQKKVDQAAINAREDRRRKAVLAGGRKSTIKTSSQGLESSTTKKTVLGA